MASQLSIPRRFGGSEVRSLSAPPSPDRITLVGAEPSIELYQPLLAWQTRVLELLPGNELDPVQCRLETADITAQEGLGLVATARLQQYDALSWVCESGDRKTSVTINGVSLDVSSTLSQALRYLRQEDVSRWVWCAALCINDEDLDEKSFQMQKHFLIYQKAASVIGWVGVPDAAADAVLSAIDFMPNGIRDSSATSCEALRAFVSRPWFQDIWSRQAAAAAEDLVLQCGNFEISFHHFCRFALHIGIEGPLEVLYADHLEASRRTVHNYDRDFTDTVFDVLSDSSMFSSKDPRDRIYASLSLIDNIWKRAGRKNLVKDFSIDYSLHVDDVYEDLMVFLVNGQRSMAILNTLGPRNHKDFMSSWTIDWRQNGLFLPTDRRDYGGQLPPMFVKDGKLTLIGAFVGTINEALDWQAEVTTVSRGSPKLRHRRSQAGLPGSLNIRKSKHKDTNILDLCINGSYSFYNIKFADGTVSGSLGIAAAREVQSGDEIAVMHGCNAPFVLRWTEDGFRVICAGWMWNTFSARSHEDEMHHFCDFDSWTQTLYNTDTNESPVNQANIRRALKTTSWHRRYWLQTGQIYAEEDARKCQFQAFENHEKWIDDAEAGNAIREYTLC